MRLVCACVALAMMTLAACTGSSGTAPQSTPVAPNASSIAPTPAGCPTTTAAVQTLLGARIVATQGAISDTQVCAFVTSTTDVGALSVIYLRFPRSNLTEKTLADARRVDGSVLAGHTVVSMPSWGTDAFLDETVLTAQDLVAEFAWVPHYEIILGMHAADTHAANRRQLIDRLVGLAQ